SDFFFLFPCGSCVPWLKRIEIMLDANFIRQNLAAVKANCANRGVKNADPTKVVQLDDERKRLVQEAQVLQQQANANAKAVGPEKDQAKKQALIAEGKSLRERVGALEKQLKQVEADLHTVLMTVPNMTHPDAPVSLDPTGNRILRTVGTPPKF